MAVKFLNPARIRLISGFGLLWSGALFFHLDLNGVKETSRYPMIEAAVIWLGWPAIIFEAVREWRKEKRAVLARRAMDRED